MNYYTFLRLLIHLIYCIHLHSLMNISMLNFNRWRLCFWVSVVPAALLIVLMEFCVESPHWLFKVIPESLMCYFTMWDDARK